MKIYLRLFPSTVSRTSKSFSGFLSSNQVHIENVHQNTSSVCQQLNEHFEHSCSVKMNQRGAIFVNLLTFIQHHQQVKSSIYNVKHLNVYWRDWSGNAWNRLGEGWCLQEVEHIMQIPLRMCLCLYWHQHLPLFKLVVFGTQRLRLRFLSAWHHFFILWDICTFSRKFTGGAGRKSSGKCLQFSSCQEAVLFLNKMIIQTTIRFYWCRHFLLNKMNCHNICDA